MEVSGRDILTKNGKLTKEDFAKRSLVHEAVVDVEDLNDRCPEISELLMEQEWEIALLALDEKVLMLLLLKDFNHSMVSVNHGCIQPK